MKKRTEHFIQDPPYFQLKCDLCNGSNILWSEFESHIWCNDCQKDVEQSIKGDFYPVGVSKLLGFDLRRWDMINKCIIDLDK